MTAGVSLRSWRLEAAGSDAYMTTNWIRTNPKKYDNLRRAYRTVTTDTSLSLFVMRVELLLLALLVILPSAAAEAGHSAEDELAGTCGCVRRSTPSALLEGGCDRAAPDRLSQGSLDAPLSWGEVTVSKRT